MNIKQFLVHVGHGMMQGAAFIFGWRHTKYMSEGRYLLSKPFIRKGYCYFV